jgi:hypothetical protein
VRINRDVLLGERNIKHIGELDIFMSNLQPIDNCTCARAVLKQWMDQQEQLIWFRSYLLDNNSDFFDKGNILISNNINYTQPLHQHNVKQTPRIHIAKTKEEIKRKKISAN